jgi:D-alanyl-lipoteichoic acid acyltransferase DltB (MBOAT superfamily)
MLFNSLAFLFFFPLVSVLYFLLPHRFRWLLLLLASCYFYMYFIPVYMLILALIIVVDYVAGIAIERNTGSRRKLFLVLSITVNLGMLALFKYYNFLADNFNILLHTANAHPLPLLSMALPLGLSFHTFQALSYTTEVYRGNQKAEKHFGIYALYVMFFPQLVAGPIERPQNLLHQFYEKHSFQLDRIFSGLNLMLWGFFKKLAVADRIAFYVDPVYAEHWHMSGWHVFTATVLYYFQMYCDFSGYTDIARGAARVLGINLMLNFNNPLRSKSVTEFWRRWHISLSTWLNDYLYTPLLISWRHAGKWAIFLALVITFSLSGLWHGADWTFIVWGLLHGAALTFEYASRKSRRKLSNTIPFKIYNALSSLLTFSFISLSLVFFRAGSVPIAISLLRKLFTVSNYHYSKGIHDYFCSGTITSILNPVFLLLNLLIVIFADSMMDEKRENAGLKGVALIRQPVLYALAVLIFFAVANFTDASTFIYFQF